MNLSLASTFLLLLLSNASVAFGSGVRGGSLEEEQGRKLELQNNIGIEEDEPVLRDVTQLEDEIDQLTPRVSKLVVDTANMRQELLDQQDYFETEGGDDFELIIDDDEYEDDDGDETSESIDEEPKGNYDGIRARGWSGSYSSYNKYHNKGCRTRYGGKGSSGHEYDLYRHVSRDYCERKCNGKGSYCYGYEYYSYGKKCEVWKVPIKKVQYVHGLNCYIKKH